ncbi:hypothetical protein JTE90_014416 [Oedothorax gibbosus]|uniref:BAH domain-containing protein n=1 Tax=Oedothorax gibbosus TaxID=931172 RepID=A0AAV6UHH4_9ARAC|nr:hypothetical protein JTE90_014416 [Oedothorax gibbosus]
MSATKSSSRSSTQKKDGGSRYATRFLALEKGKRNNPAKEANSSKSCNCVVKSDGGKGGKTSQTSKLPVKKTNTKCISRDTKKKSTSANHREKVVIVSKRSSSVSVVKSCKLRKSVSVKKVSYSTSVVLSSEEEEEEEEEEDTDSEDEESEEEEEKKREFSRKKRTVLKRTTSRVKSSVRETKKADSKAKKKDRAIKMLCEKLSSGKRKSPSRELRPRFPYSNVLQEWPTARTHRMASLNALAKVHVLYENEGKVAGENTHEADEAALIDFLDNESDEDSKRDIKPIISNLKKQERLKAVEDKSKNWKKEKATTKPRVIRRAKKRKLPEVEIIDTRVCKRMASLNASAILAASYQFEPKPKQTYRRLEKCYDSSDTETEVDLSIVKVEKDDEEEIIETPRPCTMSEKHKLEEIKNSPDEHSTKSTGHSFSKRISKLDVKNQKNLESEVTIIENKTSAATVSNRSCTVASTAATTQVGMTKYTEVTKVQINTHKDSAIKEESKSERKIKHVVSSNEDVAITQMYRYQSETANETYCVQMQTTYKPGSKPVASATNLPPTSEIFPRDSSLPSTSGYFGHTSMLPSQAYPSVGPIPPVGIDRRLPRHYGASAFSVPHYKHSQHMPFSSNEYGYYQPAGPLIQPGQDQVIHKPVPYHPQPNRNQTPQRPQPTPHREGFQGFEPRQTQQNKPATLSHSPLQQESPVPSVPKSDAVSQVQSPSSTQTSRSSQSDASRNRSPSSNASTSFQQPAKHVRSPVMPTLYSSQNSLRSYQTQKRMPTTFGSYGQPHEKKEKDPKLVGYEPRKESEPKLVGYEPRKERPKLVGYDPVRHASTSTKSPSDAVHSQSPFQSKNDQVQYQSQPSTSYSTGHFKNASGTSSSKQRMWDYKPSHGTSSSYHASLPSRIYNSGASSGFYNQETSNVGHSGTSSKICQDASSNFLPYRSSFRKDVHLNLGDTYPRKSPPVITIDEDSPRDTKTFIQLEVPKNSHREKIVIVDVEDDDIDPKHNYTETINAQNTSFNKSQGNIVRKNIPSKQGTSSTVTSNQLPDSLDKKYISKNVPLNTTISTYHSSIDKNYEYSKNSNIPYPSFDKSQGKIENKNIHSSSSHTPRSIYDKAEIEPALSRNTDELKPILQKSQPEKEKTQANFSRDSSIPLVALDRPQDQTEKPYTYLNKSDVPKETSNVPQDKIEKKQNQSKSGDINKAIFNRPQDKVEKKYPNLKSSDKLIFDRPQNKTEKEPTQSEYIDLTNSTLDNHQNKLEDKNKPAKNIEPTFNSPQEKSISTKKSIPQTCHVKNKSSFSSPPVPITPDISIVKVERVSDSDSEPVKKNDAGSHNRKCDKSTAESQEATNIEVKKKKESAVVRRAKMQGKQRTFRDCYNRPLEQLSKNKKKGEFSNLLERSLSREFQPQVSLTRLVLPKMEKPPAHGWSWEGTPFDKDVFISNDDKPVKRRCYPSIRHVEGDIISERDCVFLRSGPRKTDVPFVAKVTALWEMPTSGEMTMSLLWYYRPEHTEMGKKFPTSEDEILASKHRDINSVACIEDKCYVLTYSEYCRYKKRCRVMEDSTALTFSPVPEGDGYKRNDRLPPPEVSPDLVLFCRRVYDYRQKRLLKNPL